MVETDGKGRTGGAGMGVRIALGDRQPRVAEDAYVAPTAVLIGDVVVEPGASVWFGAVLRADFNRIIVGRGSCVQDNAVIHTAEEGLTEIGPNVTVGHMAVLEGCVIEEGALIGMGAIVLPGARVGRRAIVAAGAVVKEGDEIPPEVLAAGVPAQVKKGLSGSAAQWVERAAWDYQALRLRYMREARPVE